MQNKSNDNEKKTNSNANLAAIKLPFNVQSNRTEIIDQLLSLQNIKKMQQAEQTIKIKKSKQIPTDFILSKSKSIKPLYEIITTNYRNKKTGELISVIEECSQITKIYDYTKLYDFYLVENNQHEKNTIHTLKNLLRQKILDQQSTNLTNNQLQPSNQNQVQNLTHSKQKIENFKFLSKPAEYLKAFNLPIPSSDLLLNKVKNKQKRQYKSQYIAYGENLPESFQQKDIPEYVKNSLIYKVVKEYLSKRPCWIRNVLEYQLKTDGYKGVYTSSELKNILKFLCYTYRDGPWKHVFCRFGYSPTKQSSGVLYQILSVKIKKKQVEDYDDKQYSEEKDQSQQKDKDDDIYDPTFREMPTKYMRIYQLCDVQDERIQKLIKYSSELSQKCNKQTGWLSKQQFQELQKIIRSMREQKTKN